MKRAGTRFLGMFLLVAKVFIILHVSMNSFFGSSVIGWAESLGLAFGLTLGAAIGISLERRSGIRANVEE